MPNGEDVRLKVDHVKSKKVEGTLYMMSERMAWMPKHKDVFTLSFDYCDIKYHRISSDEKSKIRLQVVCYNEMMTTFHFCNSTGLDAQKKDRDSVSDLLKILLPEFKTMMDQALEVKTKILNENKTVYQLYKDLVISGLVPADDFWSKYVDFDKLTESTKKQNTGVSGAFLTNIRPESGDSGGIIYKLNADTIMSIFRTYPAIREKYEQNVHTGGMNEADFWRTFFQSHYFTMDRMHSSHHRDLFADCVKQDDEKMHNEAERASRTAMAVIAPETNDTSEIGYGVNESASDTTGKNDLNKNLIKRFNFHSTMILKSTLGTDTNYETSSASRVEPDDDEDISKKFKSGDNLEDLRTEQQEETQTLKLVNPDRYLRAPTIDRSQKISVQQIPTNFNNLKQEMANWHVNTELTLNSGLAHKIVKDLTPGGALMHGTTAQTLSQIVPQNIQEEMQTIYVSLSELLRHFWSSFPPSSPLIEEKIHRVHETIERFRETQVNAFKEKVSTDLLTDFHLAGHMEDLIDTANVKYNQWVKTVSSIGRT
ncbi:unnamed protein product [Rotaria magnacalcarata]|uniref:BSD domain-containing protein n=7 Tax=Rotaria magnacalcarata TaxID=392030 RepID=A0A816ZUP4_9BILA|nr:unnamed protein product [Rotaria magnacalcarata]CAF4049824.1 unnamed protein product [Rotaria magnacalcarata]